MITDSKVLNESNASEKVELDLLINAVGFETRALFAYRSGLVVAEKILSFAFPVCERFAYRDNLNEMKGSGAKILFDPLPDLAADDFFEWFTNSFEGKKIRVGVDVSSMNRAMIAAALVFLASIREQIAACLIFYSPQVFVEPPKDFPRLERVGPGLPELGGHDGDPGLPVGMIISVGYEYGVAVGLINKVEPQITVCLHGVGTDPRFETAVKGANLDFDFGIGNVQLAKYMLYDPVGAFRYIDELIYGMVDRYRVLVIPLGPKLVSALMALLSIKYFGKIAFWRVVEERSTFRDALPSGEIIVASVDLMALMSARDLEELRAMSIVSRSQFANYWRTT